MSKFTKRPVVDDEVCVHVMSRVVQKRFLMDERGMGEMRRILRTQAAFAGMEVITFCFLKNHFHVLLHVDPLTARKEVSDGELVRRFRALYGTKRSPSLGVDAEALEVVLRANDGRAERIRQKLGARMGDVSVFMRELKTRFTFWYNEHYHTVGTFWAERFRSVLVEPGSLALRAVAAYIDLNAVRAGLAERPQAYRHCGLGEAAAGGVGARRAYQWLARRRRGWRVDARSPGDVFRDYEAYVERFVTRLKEERRRLDAERGPPDAAPAVEEAPPLAGYQGKGGALGSSGWIQELCRKTGFLRSALKAPWSGLTADAAEDVHALRRWRSGE